MSPCRALFAVLLTLALLADHPAVAGPYALLATIPNPDPEANDFFGYPIAAVGTGIVVGETQDDALGEDTGAVHLFDGDPASPTFGTLIHTFTKPGASEDDYFGAAVAAFGPNVLASSVRDDTAGPDAGAVYLFDGDVSSPTFGAVLQTYLNPAPSVNDYFGYAVIGVGNNVAVADYRDAASGAEAGAVYLFDGATGVPLHTFFPPENGEHRFGYDLAAIGTRLVVGVPHGPSLLGFGSVCVYDADPASPTFGDLSLRIDNPSPLADEFGSAVATVGGNVLVGAPFDTKDIQFEGSAYLFDGATGALLATFANPNPTVNGQFGYAVSVVGTLALVAAQHDETVGGDAGAVYVYDADPVSPRFGALVQSIFPAAPNPAGYRFGAALAGVGSDIVVGSPFANGVGLVQVFTPCGDGVVSAVEDCEDGNLLDGDCCSSSCHFDPAGAACEDGDADACTVGTCTGAGVCVAAGAVPQPGCRAPTQSRKAQIRIDARPGKPGRLQWKWKSGAATPLAAFGDPRAATDYTLCVYDESAVPQPLLRASAPAGGEWHAAGTKGFRYKDAAGTPDGLQKVGLVAGPDGKAAIDLQGKGAHLATPTLPLSGKVTVQLKGPGLACWESEHTTAARNTSSGYKAPGD